MPQKTETYDLMISCPSDMNEYVKYVKNAVDHFNGTYGLEHGITIRKNYYLDDSFAESGGRPQNLINYIVDHSDLAVAIFWKKFGEPTGRYSSGTEEEIMRFIKANKQVFVYFFEKPVPPSEYIPEEYQRIVAFKEKYKNKGIYFTVKDEKELESKFQNDLEKYYIKLHTTGKKKHTPVRILIN